MTIAPVFLKHQVERWGINHLDGRRVEEYPPDAIIPNRRAAGSSAY
jgi:hypothetical protein